MVPPITQDLPTIPPVQRKPPLQQQTWQGTSYDSAWETHALEALPPPSSLVPGLPGMPVHIQHQAPRDPQTSSSTPPFTLTTSGTTSTFPILPSFHDEAIHTKTGQQIPEALTTPTESHLPTPTTLPYVGTSPYVSPSNLPLHQEQQGSPRQSSNLKEPRHPELDSPSQGGEGSLQEQQMACSTSRGSTSTTGTGGKWKQSER